MDIFKYASGFFILAMLGFASCSPNTEEQLGEVRSRLDGGKFQEAVSLLDDILQKDASSAVGFNMRGVAHYNLGNNGQALRDYEQAIELAPESYKAYLNRAHLYRRLNKPELALADYDKAVDFGGESYDIFLNRGLIYLQLKKAEEAKNDFLKAQSLDASNDKFVPFYLGKAAMLAEDFEASAKHFQAAIALDEQFAEAYFDLATALLGKNGPNEESCGLLEKASGMGHKPAEQLIAVYCKK